ncbi:hypothetical protein PH586_18120 [Pseudomonas sp. SA3-5]|uniref:Uncharacterized protein n=1 Tax=Pseudomonas aestuarii TaxID=3018340 RepID=A0ABT4XJD2_9PSED|nr:hypothetical protein [Pseudomonas aestuarii]MDA7088305.1 hypothetical protein [Pseudomonas aestuarii]
MSALRPGNCELPLRCNQIEMSPMVQQSAWDGQLQAMPADGLQVLA